MSPPPTTPPVRYSELVEPLPEGAIDLPAFVPGDGELELDVGFGRGRSLFARARARPDVRVIGVELKAKWAYKVEERRARDGLDNAKALRANVHDLLARSGPDHCLSRVYVHFPDPWWKKRHAKRRVVGESFLDQLARLIRIGGQLLVQTDVDDRADDYEALLRAHPAFGPAQPGGFRIAENPFESVSNREARAAEDGLPVYRLLAERVPTDDPPPGAG